MLTPAARLNPLHRIKQAPSIARRAHEVDRFAQGGVFVQRENNRGFLAVPGDNHRFTIINHGLQNVRVVLQRL